MRRFKFIDLPIAALDNNIMMGDVVDVTQAKNGNLIKVNQFAAFVN